MTDVSIQFQNLSFTYERATQPLIIHNLFGTLYLGLDGSRWRKPQALAVDEPTNHLDLPSIECLEQALAACPCGSFLVSHDRRFLDALAHIRWHISEDRKMKGYYILEMR